MPKYIVTCELLGYHDECDAEGSTSQLLTQMKLSSKVLNFPNEVSQGQEIVLNDGDNSLTERVVSSYHDIRKGYTVLDLGEKTARHESEERALSEFNKLLEKYSFINNL